jgi:1-acyl-sn-glycerol-3-phosphate acyltransferase
MCSAVAAAIPDDVAQLREFHAICKRDLASLSGLSGSPLGRRLVELGFRSQLQQFAVNLSAYNEQLDRLGLAPASQELCARYNGRVAAEGLEHIPRSGPFLLVSNHPGMFDALAIFATIPRPDIRALARPQPLLGLMSSLAPNLLMLPDEGPGRAGSLRQVLQSLRADGALLVFPAGHLEPEPMLIGRHSLSPAGTDPLVQWSSGVGTLVKLAVRAGVPLRVVPMSSSGVLSTSTWRWFGPIIRTRRTLRGREDLTAVLQVAFPKLGPTTIRIRYGEPLDAAALAADDDDADAITARIKARVRAQLMDTLASSGG